MSKKNSVHVKVSLRESNGDFNRMLRKFIKKVKKERIIDDYLDKVYYEKPSSKRRRQKLKKLRNAQKAERERNKKLDIK
tara:strand:+ start:190 stop:426 length:237 start_codon:yes stop_codon:yes gene_type:complete